MKVEKGPTAAKSLKIELDALTTEISDAINEFVHNEERHLLDSTDGSSPTRTRSPSNLVH
jgi:hypothetical protein